MNKNSVLVLICVLALIALSLTGGFIYLLNHDNILNKWTNSEMTIVDSITKEENEVEEIYLNLLSTDVEIRKSEKDIVIEYYSNQTKNVSIKDEKGTISLDEDNMNSRCIGICNTRRKVIVYLPESYSKTLKIDTKSGDIKSQIKINNLNASTMSGDVEINDAKTVSIKTMSGDVETGIVKNASIDTMSGDVDVEEVSEDITIETMSGDVKVYKLNITKSSSIKTSSGDVEVLDNKVNCYIDTDTSSGNIKVKKSDRKSEIELKVKTSSGDIKVN